MVTIIKAGVVDHDAIAKYIMMFGVFRHRLK